MSSASPPSLTLRRLLRLRKPSSRPCFTRSAKAGLQGAVAHGLDADGAQMAGQGGPGKAVAAGEGANARNRAAMARQAPMAAVPAAVVAVVLQPDFRRIGSDRTRIHAHPNLKKPGPARRSTRPKRPRGSCGTAPDGPKSAAMTNMAGIQT